MREKFQCSTVKTLNKTTCFANKKTHGRTRKTPKMLPLISLLLKITPNIPSRMANSFLTTLYNMIIVYCKEQKLFF